ncbi:MAG: TPM domain-containing protein [Actinomycetaceae bacterium]|nr:TPM domain-containing protein [Actinomycetaceae bacterium]
MTRLLKACIGFLAAIIIFIPPSAWALDMCQHKDTPQPHSKTILKTGTVDDDLKEAKNSPYPNVIDLVDVLSDKTKQKLQKKSQEIAKTYTTEVTIVFTDNFDDTTSEAYADDFFDRGKFGIGTEHEGILLAVAVEQREMSVSAYGKKSQEALPSDKSDNFLAPIKEKFGEDDWDGGATAYFNQSQRFIDPRVIKNVSLLLGTSAAGGIAAGGAIAAWGTAAMARKHQTAVKGAAADDYADLDSLQITQADEYYLYSREYVTERKQPRSSDRVSSSGRTHTGGSTSF